MSDDRLRDLMRGLGDAVVPLADERTAAAARARALPRIEASLRGVATSNVRRSRARRVAVAIGIAAALALGAASAAMLTRASIDRATDPLRGPSTLAPAPVTDPASAPIATASPAHEIPSASPAEAPAAKQAVDDPPKGEAVSDPRPVAATSAPPRATAARASASSEVSTLSDQNRLLASALDARRRNDDAKAIVFLNELLRKYPTSPLAQEARVERLRCLERLGQRGAAADEARRYLTDYPDGFAREEAKGQVLPAPSGRANKP